MTSVSNWEAIWVVCRRKLEADQVTNLACYDDFAYINQSCLYSN